MIIDLKFEETSQRLDANLAKNDMNLSSDFGNFQVLHDGQNGATFIPSVSESGIISWTNDRELENPKPVNIKGEKGDKGEQGVQGIQGEKGEKGDKGDKGDQGIQGERGATGANGKDGTNGTDGKDGADGKTPVKGEDCFTEADKAEMVDGVKGSLATEQWVFTLEDGTQITKAVYVG